jgi:cytochrome P450 family 110
VFGVPEDERVVAFTEAILDYLHASNPLFFFVKVAQTRWFPPWRTFLRTFERLDTLLQEQIDHCRAYPGADDILAAMLDARYADGSPMCDEDVKSELRTLLFAGHDTTAITLTWAVDHIFRDEALLHRLRAHVDSIDDDASAYAGSELLENTWKETLRLHPVVTEALRTVNTSVRLGETEVPAGEAVAACISLVHRDPELYPEPDRFDPDRFARRKYASHEYFPFGGGHRRCLGAAFAGYQLQVVLGVLLRQYEVRLLDAHPPKPVRRNVTLAPKGDVPVVFERRRASRADADAA